MPRQSFLGSRALLTAGSAEDAERRTEFSALPVLSVYSAVPLLVTIEQESVIFIECEAKLSFRGAQNFRLWMEARRLLDGDQKRLL